MRSDQNQFRLPSRRPARVLRVSCIVLTAGVLALPAIVRSATPGTMPAETQPAPGTRPGTTYRQAAIIPITDEISDVTLESLKRRIRQAQQDGADLLVFEMDTPGGQVSSALKICDAIKALPERTVAWVNTKAYSAGAIISIACSEILMAKRSTIGDAQPILIGPEGPRALPKDIEAKGISPLLEEVRDSALRNGYSVLLCEAMMRPELEVYWVENAQTGERRFVTREQRNQLFGITTTLPAGATQPVELNETSRTDWRYIASTPLIPNVKQPIVASNELLTMSQYEAIAYGFARPTMVSSAAELQDYYGLPAPPRRLEYTWSEDLTAWLTSPVIRAGLLLIALLAGYIELNTPGLGAAGAVAVVCLALFLGAPYLSGLADIWDILLVVAGIVLLAVEVFVLPGFGVAGLAGIVLLLIGLVASFVPADWPDQSPFTLPSSDYAWSALKDGILAVTIALVGSLAGAILLSRFLPKAPLLRRLVLANPQPQQVSIEDWFASLPKAGQTGVTISPLRPAGKARVNGKLVDVVAESDFIDADQPVQVVERQGNRVVVRKMK